MPVRTHEHRTVRRDLPQAHPRETRVVEVALDVTDAHCVKRDARIRGQLAGRLTPHSAMLARDQQEPAGGHQVLDRPPVAVLVIDPGMGQR